jgi:hypothetical protein
VLKNLWRWRSTSTKPTLSSHIFVAAVQDNTNTNKHSRTETKNKQSKQKIQSDETTTVYGGLIGCFCVGVSNVVAVVVVVILNTAIRRSMVSISFLSWST